MVRPPVGAARSLNAVRALDSALEFPQPAPLSIPVVEVQDAARRITMRRCTRHGLGMEGPVRKTDSMGMIGYCYCTIVRRNPIKKLRRIIALKPPKAPRKPIIQHPLPCSACIWALLFQGPRRLIVSP